MQNLASRIIFTFLSSFIDQDRDQWRALANTVMNLRIPYNVGKFLSSCTTDGFSRRAQLREVS
jgi:hypothetical protein